MSHTLQTAAAFDRLNDALKGNTNDDLKEIIENLEYYLYRAKQIYNATAADNVGSDYAPTTHYDLPN